MKQHVLVVSLLLAATATQAQVRFSVGPRVGLSIATADVMDQDYPAKYLVTTSTSSRTGLEAGIMGAVESGHFGVQLSALYSQKGFRHQIETSYNYGSPLTQWYDDRVRLNYLSFPLNFTFTTSKTGQGLQLLAGPYASVLVGGYRATGYSSSIDPTVREGSYAVHAGDAPANTYDFYTQHIDVGAQAGAGFRLGSWQAQLTYSQGLRNLATYYEVGFPTSSKIARPPYHLRAFQLSVAYLFGPHS